MPQYSNEFKNVMTSIEVINTSKNNLPEYSTDWDAGCDVRVDFSNINSINDINYINNQANCEFGILDGVKFVSIPPYTRIQIPTGIQVNIPKGYEIQIRPRSGLSYKHGLKISNSPGTIDYGYKKNQISVLLETSNTPFIVVDGDRIAQMVLAQVAFINWIPVTEFTDTFDRGGGLGHTNIR